jgi:hypothetical protein
MCVVFPNSPCLWDYWSRWQFSPWGREPAGIYPLRSGDGEQIPPMGITGWVPGKLSGRGWGANCPRGDSMDTRGPTCQSNIAPSIYIKKPYRPPNHHPLGRSYLFSLPSPPPSLSIPPNRAPPILIPEDHEPTPALSRLHLSGRRPQIVHLACSFSYGPVAAALTSSSHYEASDARTRS